MTEIHSIHGTHSVHGIHGGNHNSGIHGGTHTSSGTQTAGTSGPIRRLRPTLRLLVLPLLALSLISVPSIAQIKVSGSAEFDRDSYDFGDIVLGSGPVSCTFTLKNIGQEPLAIYSVVSSCGCTEAQWTKSPIKPGESGKISATYSNNEAPLPFDKNLTVYLSGMKKPVILKLRGVCRERKLSLAEAYPVHFGNLGFKTLDLKSGNILQGECRSGEFKMANIGKKTITVKFTDLSAGLGIEPNPLSIPAGGEVTVGYTVQSSEERWGKNHYLATPVVDGVSSFALAGLPYGVKAGKLRIFAYTTDNFTSLSEAEKSKGPIPRFKTSTFSFGKIKAGRTVDAVFDFTNEGKSDFIVHKCDVDAPKSTAGAVPTVAPGESGQIRVSLDTAVLPKGETLIIVTLATNSPLRPMVNLFISGYIE